MLGNKQRRAAQFEGWLFFLWNFEGGASSKDVHVFREKMYMFLAKNIYMLSLPEIG